MAENDDTRGMTLRELLLELRNDVKEIQKHMSYVPTRKEVYGVIAAILTIGIAAVTV